MKRVDTGEYFNAKQENLFSEYRHFSAEEYYATEYAAPPAEVTEVAETFSDRNAPATKGTQAEKTDFRRLKKQYEEISQSSASSSGSAGSSGSSASAAQTASTAAAAQAGGAAAGISTVAVAVIAFVVITVGLFAGVGKFISLQASGMDYLSVAVDIDKIIAEEEQLAGLTAADFTLEVTTDSGTEVIPLLDGLHTYLVTGLSPGTDYTYQLVCRHPSLGERTVCCEDTLSTPAYSSPCGVYDEPNNAVVYDEQTQTASLVYSVYFSDFENTVHRPTFYLCSAEQTDFLHIDNILCTNDTKDSRGFFRGTVEGITDDVVYMYVVGEQTETGEAAVLFSRTVDIGLPEGWGRPPHPLPALTVDETAERVTCLPDSITVEGGLDILDVSRSFSAYVRQYNADGTLLGEDDAYFTAESETMSYVLGCSPRYGVAAFRYVICTEEDGEWVTVYESGLHPYTLDLDFEATYTKVAPQDATLQFEEGRVTITVDPNFSTEYPDIFYYRLQVTNSDGMVYGTYSGTGQAVIEMYDVIGLDALHFVYADCAWIAGEERVYAEERLKGPAFGYPTVTLQPVVGFDGTYFTLDYDCQMVYDYAGASMELTVSSGTDTYIQQVNSVSAAGTIVLDAVVGEPGQVTVSGRLYFKDNTAAGATHSVPVDPVELEMNYRFSVTSVSADLATGSATIPVTMKFAYMIPSSYTIFILDEGNGINLSFPLTEEYWFNSIPSDATANLTVRVKDGEGNPWGTDFTCTVSRAEAEANYTEPYLVCVNPGDALVTYNDDGTINIYRKIDFSCDDSRVSCNAFIYGSVEEALGGRMIYNDSYDIISRDKYAVIENIPMRNYYFLYHHLFTYNGVCYTMYTEMPSGGVTFPEKIATAGVTQSGGTTTVSITTTEYGRLDNRIVCGGQEYTYTTYTDPYDPTAELVLEGEQDIGEVEIFFTAYSQNYDAYSTEITLKGQMYYRCRLTIVVAMM